MDKRPVYPSAEPLDVDILQPQRNVEIALGFLMRAAFGLTTVIDGLAVIPTSPASMAVSVGPGSIITLTTVDTLTSGFGSLAVDNSNSLVKIGINLRSTTMTPLAAPPVSGQSQNWLVECQFLEVDSAPVVLPYYDAANPSISYSGPSNAGTPNNTARQNIVQLQWRGGTPAVTGTQNTPTPDVGWTPVALVTLANGQSSITSSSITPYAGAPYVPTKMPFQRIRLSANLNIYVSPTGSDVNNSGRSAASPFLTLQHAWSAIITAYDINGFNVTVNVADGTYTGGLEAAGQIVGLSSGNFVYFLGNISSPANCVISTTNAHCFHVTSNAVISVGGFKMTATGTTTGNAACALATQNTGAIAVNGAVEFGACAGAHMWSQQSSSIFCVNGYTISGSAVAHFQAGGCSEIIVNNYTATITGTPAFSTGFAYSLSNSYIQAIALTFTGSATGPRYLASVCGTINTSNGGASFFPGSVAGSVATGGQYV